MVASVAVFPPGFRVTDANDEPVSGATIEFYGAGTSTPKTVYSDKDLAVAIGTSFVTDAGGYPTSSGNKVLIYTNAAPYKIIIKDDLGVVLATHDNCLGAIEGGSGSGAGLTSTGTFGINVGDVKLSVSANPAPGFIRLLDTPLTLLKANYPDLNAWASREGYPWGSAATTFNIPAAGGYFLRFGASGTTIDPSGPRTPGTSQNQQLLTHTHTWSGSTETAGNHSHTYTKFSYQYAGDMTDIAGTWAGNGTGDTSTAGAHTHTVSGINAAPVGAGDENRPVNVTMYADMLAVPALVSAGLVGANGFAYAFKSTTNPTDITEGLFGFNNLTLASATTLFINETDALGSDLSGVLQSIPGQSYAYITKVGNPAVFIAFTITSSATDAGTYKSFSISNAQSGGTLDDDDAVSVLIMRAGNLANRIELSDGSTTVKPAIASSGNNLVLEHTGTTRWSVYNAGAGNIALIPWADNVYSVGVAGNRPSVIYSATGTINTSDAREKRIASPVDERLRAVGRRISLHAYQWLDAISKKGDRARLHIGPMAQEVEAAFQAEGLDPRRYGAFCEEDLFTVDADGHMVPVLEPDGTQRVRLSLRMDQVLALMIAGLVAPEPAKESPKPIAIPDLTPATAIDRINAAARAALENLDADVSPWVYEAKRREAKEVLDDPAPTPGTYPLLAAMVLGTDTPAKADYDAAALKLFEYDRARAVKAARIEKLRGETLAAIVSASAEQLRAIITTFEGATA